MADSALCRAGISLKKSDKWKVWRFGEPDKQTTPKKWPLDVSTETRQADSESFSDVTQYDDDDVSEEWGEADSTSESSRQKKENTDVR
ncbi:hypothetical protein GN244_ATG10920 [Phytophthora infestans]|uniref:Uncharacterized protein n=1 Tax=Phytophthora infestans TaxID=4787 RepID=A0A833W0N7_PHYIN|nr:hypothetical protein GN244_ATG10920 [Phytophthora infestans]KAF4141664.1 hypothetical protein GN958_ATG09145 [Phytophthora infestans]KAF4146217.1 hypothetical protein GN958_ATG04591 [Phytophthora infestans]